MFESSCSHLNFRFRACFEQGVPWHSGNYRVWIHSETRTWHNKNIQLISSGNSDEKAIPAKMFFCAFFKIFNNIFWQSTSRWKLLKFRGSRQEVLCEKDVVKNFAKFTGKHLSRHEASNFIKKRLLAQVFCKIFKNIFLIEYLWWLLL